METKTYKDILFILIAECISLCLFIFLARGNIEMFVVDDNMKQWEPIIQVAYDYLFKTGDVAYIDFFQYNKMNIFDVGYYGINNPFMLLAYTISRYFFSFSTGIIPIYVLAMIFAGNIFLYLLMKKFKLTATQAFIATIIYTTNPIFYLFTNYYYSFNNYFFIPFLLYVIYTSYGKKVEYFFPGICLAFGISLGHAQYLAYYYMLYAIIEITHFLITKNKKQIKVLLANLSTAFLLSLPNIVLLIDAASRRSINLIKQDSFFMFPLRWENFFNFYFPFSNLEIYNLMDMMKKTVDPIYNGFMSFVFLCFLYLFIKDTGIKRKIQKFNLFEIFTISALISITCFMRNQIILNIVSFNLLLLMSIVNLKNTRIKIFLSFLICIFIPELAIFLILRNLFFQKKQLNKFDCFAYGLILSIFFFVLLSLGKTSIVSQIAHKIPIIKDFRYLYKYVFILLPLIYICAFCLMSTIKNKMSNLLLTSVLCVSALLNITYCHHFIKYNHTFFNEFYNNRKLNLQKYSYQVKQIVNQKKLDTRNYKFIGVHAAFDKINSVSWNDYKAGMAGPEYMGANYASINKIFTPGGYDDCFFEYYISQSNYMYNNYLSNLITPNFILFSNNSLKFFNQVENNAVKYFIFEKSDEEIIRTFETFLRTDGRFKILRKIPFIGDALLIEISNKKAIVSSEKREKIALNPFVAKLEFAKIENEQRIRLSFGYDSHYKAEFCYEENCSHVQIVPDEEQYTILQFNENQQPKAGTITLKYKNIVCDLAVLFTVINLFLVLLFLFNQEGHHNEK